MDESRGRLPQPDALPYQLDCRVCSYYRREEIKAKLDRDPSREVDARVMCRRHLRVAHGLTTTVTFS